MRSRVAVLGGRLGMGHTIRDYDASPTCPPYRSPTLNLHAIVSGVAEALPSTVSGFFSWLDLPTVELISERFRSIVDVAFTLPL